MPDVVIVCVIRFYSAGLSHHGVSIDVDLFGLGVMSDPPSSNTLTVQVAVFFQLLGNLFIDISYKKMFMTTEQCVIKYFSSVN